MARRDTPTRILDAAERLFAEHGIDATSLRKITREARVNLAAVHYHFGSKDRLVLAAMRRRMDPVNGERVALLDEAEAGPDSPSVETVLAAFFDPAFRLYASPGHAGHRCLRMAGRLMAESDARFHAIASEVFGDVYPRFSRALHRALPDVPASEMGWRFQFMLGAMIMVLTKDKGRFHFFGLDDTDATSLRDCLVRFVAGGLRAAVSASVEPAEEGGG